MKKYKIVADRVHAFGKKLYKGQVVEGEQWAKLGSAVTEVPEEPEVVEAPKTFSPFETGSVLKISKEDAEKLKGTPAPLKVLVPDIVIDEGGDEEVDAEVMEAVVEVDGSTDPVEPVKPTATKKGRKKSK